jgi:hypothetical protein
MAEHVVIRLTSGAAVERHQLLVPRGESGAETARRIMNGTHERISGDWLQLEDSGGRWCRLDQIVEIYVETVES